MVDKLDSAKKYYAEVLKPTHDEFFQNPATFKSATALAGCLFHFHEWMWEYHRPQLEAHFGRAFAKKSEFWAYVQAQDARFAFIRDLANASKHVRLTRNPSTSMTHIANTSIQVASFDSGGFAAGAFATSGVTMRDGAADVPFDECADELFNFWTRLLPAVA